MSRTANQSEVHERFKKDTAEHQMTVVRDDGLYRHLRFRRPGTGCYGFDIVTWPGYLAISGDMGASMFTRLDDMFEFFRQKPERHDNHGGLYINCGYWREKCVANDGAAKEFSKNLLNAYVREAFDEFVKGATDDDEMEPEWSDELWAEIKSDVIDRVDDVPSVQTAIEAMQDFEPDDERYKRFRFHDAWEAASSLEDYTFHFLWRLYAISHAIRAYDAAKAAEPAATAAA